MVHKKIYHFSVPMPYEKEYIDELLNLNNCVEKSHINSFFFSLPSNCELYTGFEQDRNYADQHIEFDYWKNLINYSIEKGIDFIYLLNNVMPFDLDNPNFNSKLKKLDRLLDELHKIGVKKLRVGSYQLMSYLSKYHNEFKIYASTGLEYKTLREYINFITFHPEVKQIVISQEINKNFKLIKNLRKAYPNLEIEIIVNEACMKGCPHRILHQSTIKNINANNEDLFLSERYCLAYCSYIMKKYPFYSITLNNGIFPWELQYYYEIGINKFKLTGRELFNYEMKNYIERYLHYLKAVDNINSAENLSINTFFHHCKSNPILSQIKTKEVFRLLPNIKHFIKKGHLCSSLCGIECQYCYKCAEKIEKVFKKQQEEKNKRTIPFCVITKTKELT